MCSAEDQNRSMPAFMVNILMSSKCAQKKGLLLLFTVSSSGTLNASHYLDQEIGRFFKWMAHSSYVIIIWCVYSKASASLQHIEMFYAEHMHGKWIKSTQTTNQIYFLFRKLIGIVRMHLAEIEFRYNNKYDAELM